MLCHVCRVSFKSMRSELSILCSHGAHNQKTSLRVLGHWVTSGVSILAASLFNIWLPSSSLFQSAPPACTASSRHAVIRVGVEKVDGGGFSFFFSQKLFRDFKCRSNCISSLRLSWSLPAPSPSVGTASTNFATVRDCSRFSRCRVKQCAVRLNFRALKFEGFQPFPFAFP